MPTSFFKSWALWEKMTLVLALAILTVFGIGFGKLAWRNRLMKKQEGRDKEQQMASEELQRSGQTIESQKSQDIPFGVRAIQSGIQVDGIWISSDSTPTPASLRLGHVRNNSSDLAGSQSPSVLATLPNSSHSSQAVARLASSRGRTSRRHSESGIFAADQCVGADCFRYNEAQDSRGHHPSYKPRRSSHLRYGGQGEQSYHQEALDQPKGKAKVETESCAHKASRTQEPEGDVLSWAAADNERSSGSETDMTISSNTRVRIHGPRPFLPLQYGGGNSLLELEKPVSSGPLRSSLSLQTPATGYFPVPLESPKHEQDRFMAPLSSPMEIPQPFEPPYAQPARELIASGEPKAPILPHPRSPSPFIPGELHMNKFTRKVNSGFEVLPAGTFGVTIEVKSEGFGHDGRRNPDDNFEEKRSSNKLQKKLQTPSSSSRPSSTCDRS